MSLTACAPAAVWPQQFMRLPLQRPAGGTVGTGPFANSYTYSPGDCSVGDLDGDGTYEIVVKWDPSNQQDNSSEGVTGPVRFRSDGSCARDFAILVPTNGVYDKVAESRGA